MWDFSNAIDRLYMHVHLHVLVHVHVLYMYMCISHGLDMHVLWCAW